MSTDGEGTFVDEFDYEFAQKPDTDPNFGYDLPYEGEAVEMVGLTIPSGSAQNAGDSTAVVPVFVIDEAPAIAPDPEFTPAMLDVATDEFEAVGQLGGYDQSILVIAPQATATPGTPAQAPRDTREAQASQAPVVGVVSQVTISMARARLHVILGPAYIGTHLSGSTLTVYSKPLTAYVRKKVPAKVGNLKIKLVEKGSGAAAPPPGFDGTPGVPGLTVSPYSQGYDQSMTQYPGYDPYAQQYPGYGQMAPPPYAQQYPQYPGYTYPAPPGYYPTPAPMYPGMAATDPFQDQMAMLQQMQMAQTPDGSLSYVDDQMQIMGALVIGGAPTGGRYIFSLNGEQHVVLEGVEVTPELDAQLARDYSWAKEQGLRGRASAKPGTVGSADVSGDTWLERDGAGGYKRLVFTDPPAAVGGKKA